MVQPSDAEFAAILASPYPKAALSELYGTVTRNSISSGKHLPFLVPTTFIGCFVIPPLYLAIPQRGRPWLRSLRWAVLAFIVAFNADLFLRSASTNVACGYGIGMVAVWGTMVAAMALVFLDAQDLERVAKRTRPRALTRAQKRARTTKSPRRGKKPAQNRQDKLLTAEMVEEEVEYYWESYPYNGSFGQRFLWGFDIVTSIRGAGWSWAISTMPHPPPPSKPHTMEIIDISTIPLVSRSGHTRCQTRADFFKRTLWSSRHVPPFEYPPAHLSWIPTVLLPAYRALFFLTCILAGLQVVFHHLEVVQFFVFSYLFPMRAEPWMYSSIFGPGRFPGKKAALLASAFIGSGLMHAGASFTSTPSTDYVRPLLFFLAQGVGIGLQKTLCKAVRPLGLPRWLRRIGNLLFVMAWLYGSSPLLGDDFATGGVWLLEPSPYSVLRAMGYGYPGESPWRWDRNHMGSLYVGKHWWEIGYGA
ncbi:membrane bound o-acyl transferase family protein [Ceratocystis lukuohia]|uniref:Membrane bound o-acyl transferase family protein n=1 Tax=Ceratocystis lukuohia TaxID=2019550 RepID=A0ABR4MLV5_9PEZI